MTNSKIALITGGNRGLGKATATALAADGVDVIITYRGTADEAAEVVAELERAGRRAAAVHLDIADSDSFAAFTGEVRSRLAGWRRTSLDYVINNAGHAATTRLGDTTEADADLLYAVHLKGVYFLIQTLAPMINDGGAIINLSSGLARFAGDGWSLYGAMKGAVEVLTRYLAKELGPRGIRVNVVAPGPVATDFGGGTMRDDDRARTFMAGQAAFGRVGEPDDIGRLIAVLLSDRAAWVTGQRIEASGGILL